MTKIRAQDRMEHVHQFGYSFPPIGRVNNDSFFWMYGLTLQKWNTTTGKMRRKAIEVNETVIRENEASNTGTTRGISKTSDPIALGWSKRPLDPTPFTGGYVQFACYGGLKFHVNPEDIPGTREQTLKLQSRTDKPKMTPTGD